MKYPKNIKSLTVNLLVAAAIISVPVIYGFKTYTADAVEFNQNAVKARTDAFHITAADGTKSIGQLLREQNAAPLPDQAISSFHFLVDPKNDALMFPRVEPFQPEGFQWGILPGDDKKISIPEIPLNAEQGLEFFLVKTDGTANFLLITEFYPN